MDHLLVHCTKTGILWQLVFSLFGIKWVMPDSVKEVLLSWQGNFVGGKKKFFLKGCSFMHFVDCLEEGNRRCLDNVEKLDQALTSSFFLLLEWVRVGLNDVTRSMLDLVDWLGVG